MIIYEEKIRRVLIKRNNEKYEILKEDKGEYFEQGRKFNIRALTDYVFSTPKLDAEFEDGILDDIEKCLYVREQRKGNLQKICILLAKLQQKNENHTQFYRL